MADIDLKKLNRAELLEILVKQGRELEEIKERNEELEKQLKNRQIIVEKAGSIAEASLTLNGVFEAAQSACEQYMENIRLLSSTQEERCAAMEEASLKKAQQIIEEAEEKSRRVEENTRAKCQAMINQAKNQSHKYWDEVSEKLENFYAEHKGLRELLSFVAKKESNDEEE